MDRIYVVIIALCAVFISMSPAAASDTKELTLEQAITLAIEKNPDLQPENFIITVSERKDASDRKRK